MIDQTNKTEKKGRAKNFFFSNAYDSAIAGTHNYKEGIKINPLGVV